MYFKAEKTEEGDYTSKEGTRFVLRHARRVRPADGWTVFETLEMCLNAWGLIYNPSCSPEQSNSIMPAN